MPFSEGLREARLAAGLSQHDLAVKSGVSQTGICAIERAERSPSESTMRLLAAALGYTVSELMGEAQDMVDHTTMEERALLSDFRALNAQGRALAAASVHALAGNPDMRKETASSEAVS